MRKVENCAELISAAPDPRTTAPIRTLIVDDDEASRDVLARILSADARFIVIGDAANGLNALEKLRELSPDLVLLDIQMVMLDGFEMLEALAPNERPAVVFVTDHAHYAVRAFEFGAIDFVVKPFAPDRMALALDRATRAVRRSRVDQLSREVERLLHYVRSLERDDLAPSAPAAGKLADQLVVKAGGALHFLKMADVVWIEAQGDFVKVQTSDATHTVRETLQTLEQKLDRTKFLRIHRSFVVNLEHVSRVETALYGDYSVYMDDGTKLRLSRTYRSKLKALVSRGATTSLSAPSGQNL